MCLVENNICVVVVNAIAFVFRLCHYCFLKQKGYIYNTVKELEKGNLAMVSLQSGEQVGKAV